MARAFALHEVVAGIREILAVPGLHAEAHLGAGQQRVLVLRHVVPRVVEQGSAARVALQRVEAVAHPPDAASQLLGAAPVLVEGRGDPQHVLEDHLVVHRAQLEMHAVGKDLLPSLPLEQGQGDIQRAVVPEIQGAQHERLEVLEVMVREEVLLQMPGEVRVLARQGPVQVVDERSVALQGVLELAVECEPVHEPHRDGVGIPAGSGADAAVRADPRPNDRLRLGQAPLVGAVEVALGQGQEVLAVVQVELPERGRQASVPARLPIDALRMVEQRQLVSQDGLAIEPGEERGIEVQLRKQGDPGDVGIARRRARGVPRLQGGGPSRLPPDAVKHLARLEMPGGVEVKPRFR